MAYPGVDEMHPGLAQPNVEVRVFTMNGQHNSFYMDKFGLIGDVKQRLSKEMGRKFHEMKLLGWALRVPCDKQKMDMDGYGHLHMYGPVWMIFLLVHVLF